MYSPEVKNLTESDTESQRLERVLGRYQGRKPGVQVIVVGGLHGNEPAGVQAVLRVLDSLRKQAKSFAGRFLALAGNIQALEKKQRYLGQDLNRMWKPELLQKLKSSTKPLRAEEQELLALHEVISGAIAEHDGETVLVDLHTTSSQSRPFCLFGDTLRNRRIAARIPVPMILGLEEAISGTLMEFITDQGHIGLVFETGPHDAPQATDIHEAVIWLVLAAAGCIDEKEFPRLNDKRRLLKEAARGVPPVLEVRYRHAIHPEDRFQMEHGFENLQKIRAGQLLAHDKRGPVYSYQSGRILMPLYQGLGDDGFFIARSISPFWLKVSALLRRLQADKIVHWLPGIHKHPSRPFSYIVNTHVARWFVIEIFHLLGFRKHSSEHGIEVVTRRKYDFHGPGRS